MEFNNKPVTGVTVIKSDDPSEYQVAPRVEPSTPVTSVALETSTPVTGTPVFGVETSTPASGTPALARAGPSTGMRGSLEKKRRGRPRKYGLDGVMGGNTSGDILSPTPISVRPPADSGDFSHLPPPSSGSLSSDKKLKAPVNASGFRQRHINEPEGLGFGLFTGGNFVPRVLIVKPGEDVADEIRKLYNEEGPRSICVICGSGCISSVTLREFDSSGDTMTYEGLFQIVSLSGSFVPIKAERGSPLEQCGGLSVSLATPDHRHVIGGMVAGFLTAATPVQIILGTFLPSGFLQPKQKKAKKSAHKPPPPAAAATTSAPMPPPFTVDVDGPIFDALPMPPPFTVNVDSPISDGPQQGHHHDAAPSAGTSNLQSSPTVGDLSIEDWADITGMHLGPDPDDDDNNNNNMGE